MYSQNALQGEDEAMFQDFRKQMKVLLDNIGKLVSSLHASLFNSLHLTRKEFYFDPECTSHVYFV